MVQTATEHGQAAKYGIVTDLSRLLRSRHWAQRLKLFSTQAARSMLLGNIRSRFRGRGMEFEEVRRYQPGDDIRTIDWKVSARVGSTYTKLFCEERERPCHIIVDQRGPLFFGSTRQFKSVLAAELASGLAWAALAGGDRVGGQVIGDTQERDCRARRNKQAVLRLIHDVHELNQLLSEPAPARDKEVGPATSLSNTLVECKRITRPGTAIFIVSDFHDFDETAAKALSDLGKHTDLTLIQVADEVEESMPLHGRLAVSDGVQSSVIGVSNKLKQAYQSSLAERQAQLKAAATQARALYTKITTSDSARHSLNRIFGK
ncbi:MAG: DUF58 domain-containing protein [Pseudomonadota bacterium]